MKRFLIASLALLLTLALSGIIGPSNAEVQKQKELPYTFFFTHYQLLGDPNDPSGVRYHPMANPLPKRPMARRSSSRVRAGGTQRKTPPRAVVTTPSRAPRGRSKHRDHGE